MVVWEWIEVGVGCAGGRLMLWKTFPCHSRMIHGDDDGDDDDAASTVTARTNRAPRGLLNTIQRLMIYPSVPLACVPNSMCAEEA